MLVSDSKSFLFVHVPKTGGTSLVSVLKRFSVRAPLPLRAIGYFFDDRGVKLPEWTYSVTGYPYHVRAEQLKRLWGEEKYNSYYSFAFVRNPWDLAVSEYHYIVKKKAHHLHKVVIGMSDFKQYLDWKKDNYARQQKDWLCSAESELIVKNVCRFEDYENEANKILTELDVSERIPHKNSTKRNSYEEYYDQESKELVAHIHSDDIRLFGYEF